MSKRLSEVLFLTLMFIFGMLLGCHVLHSATGGKACPARCCSCHKECCK